MTGTGHGGNHRCNDRLALNWAGIIALACLLTGAALALMALKITEGVIILLFGVPGMVIGMIAGYIGGRALAQQQSTQTGSIVNQPVVEPKAIPAEPGEDDG